MSKYMYLFRASAQAQHAAMGTPEQAQRSLQAWLGWIRDLEAKGHLKNRGEPLLPEGSVVRGPSKVVTDGPFVEIKDMVCGFIVVDARDLAEAIELAHGCPMLYGDGSVEVRPIGPLAD